MYDWIELSSRADLDQLAAHIPEEYAPKSVAKKLKDGISGGVKAVLVEHGYVDKDYRSTYYNFYAKKGRRFRADCVRLHFFDGAVSFDPAALRLSAPDRLADHYYGFMVLRPTTFATIGRSIVSPDVRSGACQFIIHAEHKVHLLGYKLKVEGFPAMEQHSDISVCAHVACWSILRHYSERYSVYREFLTHDITMMAQQFDPGGLVPSRGLDVSHAERVFQEAGTFPVLVAKDPNSPDPAFFRQLGAYVESAFPLFAAMHPHRHAIAVVGYEWRTGNGQHQHGLSYAWDQVDRLAVVDDNHLPYLPIAVNNGSPYSGGDIDAFIVALPEKIFYPADAVDQLAATLFVLGGAVDLGLPPEDETILRYFVTTGSAFRRFARDHETEFDQKLLQAIMVLPYAQFVWVVEFATKQQWDDNRVTARAVIDATASVREPYPLWLIHSQTKALIFDRQQAGGSSGTGALTLSSPSRSGFSRMVQNLRPTRAK